MKGIDNLRTADLILHLFDPYPQLFQFCLNRLFFHFNSIDLLVQGIYFTGRLVQLLICCGILLPQRLQPVQLRLCCLQL